MGRTNRELLTGGSKYKQRQVKKYGVEEVVFNNDSRLEYLNGFHKRKVERQKKAKAFYERQERQVRIEERKKAREDRQKQLEDKMKELDTLRLLRLGKPDSGYEDGNGKEDQKEKVERIKEKKEKSAATENNVWNGFDSEDSREEESEEKEEENDAPLKGILNTKHIYKIDDLRDLGDAIVDEETTVSVNSVDNPYMARAGFSLMEIAKSNHVNLQKSDDILEKSIDRARKYAVICGVAKEKPKQKQRKFRYLTKSERRENNRKARASKKKSKSRD